MRDLPEPVCNSNGFEVIMYKIFVCDKIPIVLLIISDKNQKALQIYLSTPKQIEAINETKFH